MDDQRATYGQLEAESNRLARLLVESGLRPGDRVCLCLPKSVAAIVAMHATLKAGGVYVPLDTASPAPRVAMILDAAEPRIVLTASATTDLLDGLAGTGALSSAVVGSLEGPLEGEGWKSSFERSDADAHSDDHVSAATRPISSSPPARPGPRRE